MSRVYDCWERLVAATLKRDQLRTIALSSSRDSSFNSNMSSDFSSRFSFNGDSPFYDVNGMEPHRLSESRDLQDDDGASNHRIFIRVESMMFQPNNHRISSYIMSRFALTTHPLGHSWQYVPTATRDWYWEEFAKQYRWASEDYELIRACWYHNVAQLYRKTIYSWRKSGRKPVGVSADTWAAWQAAWNNPDWQAEAVNYYSEPVNPDTGLTEYAVGSRSFVEHGTAMRSELGQNLRLWELFSNTHTTQDETFVDELSQTIDTVMWEMVDAVWQSLSANFELMSPDSINQSYLDVAEDVTEQRVYGLETHATNIYPKAVAPRSQGSTSMGTSTSVTIEAIRVAQEDAQAAREEARLATERAQAATERAEVANAECLDLRSRMSTLEETIRLMIGHLPEGSISYSRHRSLSPPIRNWDDDNDDDKT